MNFWKNFTKIKRAHQFYLGFFLSIPSSLSILYNNLVLESFMAPYFPTLARFLIVFVIAYIPILWFLGSYFFRPQKRSPKYEEAKLDMLANSWMMDMTQSVIWIAQGQNDKAIKLLQTEWMDHLDDS